MQHIAIVTAPATITTVASVDRSHWPDPLSNKQQCPTLLRDIRIYFYVIDANCVWFILNIGRFGRCNMTPVFIVSLRYISFGSFFSRSLATAQVFPMPCIRVLIVTFSGDKRFDPITSRSPNMRFENTFGNWFMLPFFTGISSIWSFYPKKCGPVDLLNAAHSKHANVSIKCMNDNGFGRGNENCVYGLMRIERSMPISGSTDKTLIDYIFGWNSNGSQIKCFDATRRIEQKGREKKRAKTTTKKWRDVIIW